MSDKAVVERLEALVAIDEKARKARLELEGLITELRKELRTVKSELKELKTLDPLRLKRNLAEQKKKMVIKNNELKAQSKELVSIRRLLREAKSELDSSQNETDAFFISNCKRWELTFTGFQYASEKPDKDVVRIRCLDRQTGTSVLAEGFSDDQVLWSHDLGIPASVSEKAAEKIMALKLPLYQRE